MFPVRRARRSLLAVAGSLTILSGLLPGAAAAPTLAAGTVSLTALGTAYSQDFDTLANTGTANTTLPLGWDLNETGTSARVNAAYAASIGSDNGGDVYSFGAASSTERGYGTLLSGTLTPIVGAAFINNTGATAGSLDLAYTGEQWRLGTTGRTDRLDFQYSLDATSLTTGTWVDVDALDFAAPNSTGTVGAMDGNAAGNRSAVAGSISGFSLPNGGTFWIRWTDFNASGADDGLAVDDFSLTPHGVSGTPELSVNAVSANEGDAGTSTFAFIVSLSTAAGAGGVTFDIATADGTATTADNDYVARSLTGQTIPAGSSSYAFEVTVVGDTTVEPNQTFAVNVTNVTGAAVADGQGQGTIVNDDVTITPIHDIQGSGDTVAPGTFTVEATVVGDYQAQGSGQLRGFFLQEEDADADASSATSEGIFVFCDTCPTAVVVGDVVRATGAASEFFGMSQLTAATAGSVTVMSSENPLPAPASIDLPVPDVPSGDAAAATAAINAYYEPREGMLVRFQDTLSVSEYFELARYGQLLLSEGGRPHTFTAVSEPSQSGLVDHEIDLARRTVILDDSDNRQNRAVDAPNTPYPHPVPGLSTANFVRGGDTIANLTGVLHWSFAGQTGTDAWRIRPVTEEFGYAFTDANPRPEEVPDVGGSLKVASFNVLNYFLTIDTTASGSTGPCGANQNLDCRGADSAQELTRQRSKLLAALSAMDADVVGLMEMENTPGVEPLANIVAGLPGYDYVDTGVIGTDAIRVGIIYKTSTVEPVGGHAILDSSVDPRFDSSLSRPVVAQTFEEKATGARITVAVNHLKSKGESGLAAPCGPPGPNTNLNCDQANGSGFWNEARRRAAEALVDWLASDPTGSGDRDALIIGDLNSYTKEDPIDEILAGADDTGGTADDYTNLIEASGGASAYSFVFDGQLGYLDHALSSSTLTPQVTGVADWHINADEIPLFDYNDDVRDAPGEAAFEEESDALPLTEPGMSRTSDHDPVIVGLDLLNFGFDGYRSPVSNPPAVNRVNAGSTMPIKFGLSDGLGLDVLFGTPTTRRLTCDTLAPIGSAVATMTPGDVGLQQDATTGQYTYEWKTVKSWAGQCRDIELTFDDGAYRRALFLFK